MKREIILGPPGTGKTTELIRRLEKAFEAGVQPEEVAFLAFTKKAADVAISRAMEHFGFGRNRFPYFRTIHSLAFHENSISTKEVMRQEHYEELGTLHGWDFQASYERLEERPAYGKGIGDQLLRCYDLAQAKMIAVEHEARIGEYPFNDFLIQRFKEQFDAYKSRYDLQTFNDFLRNPVKLDVKLVIIDEAQDLTLLQWHFVRESFRKTPEVLIAGDDDQCIYQWSGADLSFFLSIDAQVTQLKQSYRCSREIWKVADHISKRIGRRYEKHWKPVKEGGIVTVQRDPYEVDLAHGEWLILVRKNAFLHKYFKVLMASGRIFHDGNCWINEQQWFKAVLTYMRLQRGENVAAGEVFKLRRHCAGMSISDDSLSSYTWANVKWQFDQSTPWHDALQMSLANRMFIESCVAKGEDLFGPGKVRLSTIHAAKGGEADNVMLDTRLDGIPLKYFRKDPDSERRVWYVGVSRARNALYMTGATKNDAFFI